MARIAGGVGTSRGFLASVNKWTRETKERSEEAFKIGVLDFVLELDRTAPYDTGNLRSSLVAGINGNVPQGPHGAFGSVYNDQRILTTIEQLKLGDKITLVYLAEYARRLEYGLQGWIVSGGSIISLDVFGLPQRGRSIVPSCAARLLGCGIALGDAPCSIQLIYARKLVHPVGFEPTINTL